MTDAAAIGREGTGYGEIRWTTVYTCMKSFWKT